MTEAVAAGAGAVDVDALSATVSACPSVARLSGGVMGEVATYLPGRRVTGVRVRDGVVEIHVVARWVPSLPAVGEEIRGAVASLVGGRSVTVFIDDLASSDPADDPDEDHPGDATGSPAGTATGRVGR